jgi:DNA-binding transcriptional LysR family regulator
MLIGALRAGLAARRLEQRELARYRLSVVARRGHPLAGRRVMVGDLADFPWISARVGTPSRGVLATLASQFPKDRPMREMVETGSLVVSRGLMLRTDCLTLLSTNQVRYEIEAGYLEVIDVEVPDPGRPFGVTLRRNWMPTPMQAAFLAELEAAAG